MTAPLGERSFVLGLMGEKASGKSTVGRILRSSAGSHDERSDIEFSDLMIEAANYALNNGSRYLGTFRQWLRIGARWVLEHEGTMRPLNRNYCSCDRNDPSDCVEHALAVWLEAVQYPHQITRENHDENRPVLIWLGWVVWQLAGQDAWSNKIAQRIRSAHPSPLITVGGVRAPGDAEMIRREGGLVIRVIGRDHDYDRDATNAQRDLITPDVVFYNDVPDPGLSRVRAAVRQLWHDWQAGQLQSVYRVQSQFVSSRDGDCHGSS